MLKQLKDKFCDDELAIEVLFDEVCCSYSSIMFCNIYIFFNPYGILRFNYRVAVFGGTSSRLYAFIFMSSFILIPENFSLYNGSMVDFQTDRMYLLFCGFAVIICRYFP